MILIDKVEEYAQKLVDEIPELKTMFLVVDDSNLASLLKDCTDSNNIILVAFIPDNETVATNVDNSQDLDSLIFLVLEKTDSKAGHSEMLESFKRTQLAAKKIKLQMIEDKENFTDCGNTLRDLEIASIKIEPVWRLTGTNGFEISYQLKTPTF